MSLPNLHALLTLLLTTTLALAGCGSQQHHTNSSVMDYLYPNKAGQAVERGTARLHLPVRVGVAFVPDSALQSSYRNAWTGSMIGTALTEQKKEALLQMVADDFRGHDFISSIEVIPSAYLMPKGGFINLDQLKTMYGIDVIALVSYDQVQFTDEGFLTLSYWTIVGAYMVSGEKNDTHTLMDTAVFDIASRRLLFRAPGRSQIRGKATPVNLTKELREDSYEGFDEATTAMIAALKLAVDQFADRVKDMPADEIVVIRDSGASGGGAGAAGIDVLALLLLAAAISYRRRGQRLCERR